MRVQKLQRQKFNKDQWKELDLQAYLGSDDGLTDAGYGTDALVSTSESPSETEDEDSEEDAEAKTEAKAKGGVTEKPKRRKIALKRRAREKYKSLLDIAKTRRCCMLVHRRCSLLSAMCRKCPCLYVDADVNVFMSCHDVDRLFSSSH